MTLSSISAAKHACTCGLPEPTQPHENKIIYLVALPEVHPPRSAGCPGVRENTFFFKGIRDAVKLRRQISECFERASLPHTPKEVPSLPISAFFPRKTEQGPGCSSAIVCNGAAYQVMHVMHRTQLQWHRQALGGGSRAPVGCTGHGSGAGTGLRSVCGM